MQRRVLTLRFLSSKLDVGLVGIESNILSHEYSVHDCRVIRKHFSSIKTTDCRIGFGHPSLYPSPLRPMPAFYQRFQESARKFPDNVALEIQRQQTVERVTFAELTRMSESVANWLSTRVPRDARVAILAANHPRWVAAYLAIIAAGRTAVPLDTAFHADQVKKLLVDSGASLLFCDVKHLAVAMEAVEGLNVGLVMTSAAGEQVATAAA